MSADDPWAKKTRTCTPSSRDEDTAQQSAAPTVVSERLTEGSACPVGTTPEALATRRISTSIVAEQPLGRSATIEVAERTGPTYEQTGQLDGLRGRTVRFALAERTGRPKSETRNAAVRALCNK